MALVFQYAEQSYVATSGKTQYIQIPLSLSAWANGTSTVETIKADVGLCYSTISGTPNNITCRGFLDLIPIVTPW